MNRALPAAILILDSGLVSGCVSLTAPTRWICTSEVEVDDVKGIADVILGPTGHRWSGETEWRWKTRDRDFEVEMGDWFSKNDFVIYVNMSAALVQSAVTSELRIGSNDRRQSNSSLVDRHGQWPQHQIRIPRWRMSKLTSSGQDLFVVSVTPEGEVVRSVRLDTGAWARGEKAMALAREQVANKSLNFRQSCEAEYPDNSGVIA